jgi:hypothetical protein
MISRFIQNECLCKTKQLKSLNECGREHKATLVRNEVDGTREQRVMIAPAGDEREMRREEKIGVGDSGETWEISSFRGERRRNTIAYRQAERYQLIYCTSYD